MTNDQAIDAISMDASVRQAHRRTNADGSVNEPTPGELKSIAQTAIIVAVAEVIGNPDIADKLFEDRYTLTVTSGTLRYDVGQYDVFKIREILMGSTERPVRPFFEDSGDFYEWRERRYAGAALSDTNEPYAAYISGRPNGNLELSFWPGVGSETSMILVYNRLPAPPFTIESFPDHMHGTLLLGAIRWANGGAQGYSDQWESAKSDLARGLDPARGTTSKLRKAEPLRRFIRRLNARASGSPSYFYSSSKTR